MSDANTVADATPQDTTSTETPQTPQTPSGVQMSFDDLLAVDESANPFFKDDASYEGIRPIHTYLAQLPEDIQKNLANIRAMTTRKTQELANMRKELETERARVLQERELLLNSPVFQKLKEAEGEDVDIWTEDGLKRAAQIEAAKMLDQTFSPLREKLMQEQAELQATRFVDAHPDARTDVELRNMIADVMTKREDITLEDAYFLCKGKLVGARESARQAEEAKLREQNRGNLMKTSTGVVGNTKPTFRSAEEALMYHMQKAGH